MGYSQQMPNYGYQQNYNQPAMNYGYTDPNYGYANQNNYGYVDPNYGYANQNNYGYTDPNYGYQQMPNYGYDNQNNYGYQQNNTMAAGSNFYQPNQDPLAYNNPNQPKGDTLYSAYHPMQGYVKQPGNEGFSAEQQNYRAIHAKELEENCNFQLGCLGYHIYGFDKHYYFTPCEINMLHGITAAQNNWDYGNNIATYGKDAITHTEYNPGFEYFYYPSKEERAAAFNYFQDTCPKQSELTNYYLKGNKNVGFYQRYEEWLGQFKVPEEYDPIAELHAFSERLKNQPQQISDEHYYNTMRKMYNEGKITLAEYTSCANGGMEHITDSGYHAYADSGYYYNQAAAQQNNMNPFGWGGYYGNRQMMMQQYEEQQKHIQNQMENAALAQRVADRFNGITEQDRINAQKEYAEQYNKQAKLQRDLAVRQYNDAMYDNMINAFRQHVESGKRSDQKGYISPLKQAVLDHVDKTYDQRHKHVSENMSFEEFMIGGGYADIYFADMKYKNRKEMEKVTNIYDDFVCRTAIHESALFYDPRTGMSQKGLRLNNNEIELSMPPEMMAQKYGERRQRFFTRISQGRQAGVLPTDAEFFALQNQMQKNGTGMVMIPPSQFNAQISPYLRM